RVTLGDDDRGRPEVWARVEALVAGRVSARVARGADRVFARRPRDRERDGAVLRPHQRDVLRLHGHPLARLEGVVRQEAGAVAVGMCAELTAVGAGLRPADLDPRELARRGVAEADL